ncbi:MULTISPECIES: 3-hydroxyacyl-CoA dehydrogenase family protein [unclassified Microbacterium]|uniref:3-hydroxyacyl-CoA dehydrogenase family protein n=1 Tax=unclassified Microbacterium TaxID=2609290 RepID=UPI00301609C6
MNDMGGQADANDALPRVAVLGAGLMGHAIAQVFAVAGADVRVWDPDPVALADLPGRIAQNLEALGKDRTVEVQLCETLAAAVAGSDLVCEAAPERLEVKKDLVRQVEEVESGCVFATNTSVLRISEIAAEALAPERIVGVHWWNPPHLIRVVEVVAGENTSADTLARVEGWLCAAGKMPVPVCDAPGFVGNRMQFALLREAVRIVEEGIATPDTVDLVARETIGRRWGAVGPLESADYIGLDLVDEIMTYLSPSLSREITTPQLLRDRVQEGRLGAKTGGGIFDWPDGARARVTDRLRRHLVGDPLRTGGQREEQGKEGVA